MSRKKKHDECDEIINHYEAGRLARKTGKPVEDAPPKGESSLSFSPRSQWLRGWYDQHYGSKWEPRIAKIKDRIWPVPL